MEHIGISTLLLAIILAVPGSADNSTSKIYTVARNVAESAQYTSEAYNIITGVELLSMCTTYCSLEDRCQAALYDSESKICLIFSYTQRCSLMTTVEFTPLSYLEIFQYRGQLNGQGEIECCSFIVSSSAYPLYQDCQEAFEAGDIRPGKVYLLKPLSSPKGILAVCEFDSSAGWTVIQTRSDGSIDFYRNFTQYTDGFGNACGEYWIGLENIYHLTQRNRKISFYLEDHDEESRTANYSTFYIDDSGNDYTLHISGYSGDAGDSMASHNSKRFATFDHGSSCAIQYKGAWWYHTCHHSNLNGLWDEGGSGSTSAATGINWHSWMGHGYSLKTVRMRISA